MTSHGLQIRTLRGVRIPCCVIAAALLFGCDRSENANPVANNPTPTTTSASTPVVRTNKYAFGDKISFAAAGNSAPFKVSGWSGAEPQQSWTNGPEAVLAVRIPSVTEPLTLKIKCGAFLKKPEVPSQPVEVFANGQKIADWDVRDLAEYTAPISPAILAGGDLLTITLKIPKAISPKALGTGEDTRLLGLACFEASLAPGK